MTLALPFYSSQTISLSYIGFKVPQALPSQIGSVSYTVSFGNLMSLNLSAYQDFKQHDSRGVFLSMSFGLGHNTSINATVGRQNGQSNYNVNAIRPPDYDGGWGWGVQTADAGAILLLQARILSLQIRYRRPWRTLD